MDVRLPNGTVLSNVPEGTTQADIWSRLKAGGHDPASFGLEEPADSYPTLRAIADVPLSFAQGAAMSVRNISDAFGASNEFSQNVRGIEDLLGEYMSAQHRKDARAQQEILAKAKDQGVLANLQASWEYLKVAPLDTLANLAGGSAPYIIASITGGPLTGAALGAIGGAGTIKGDIYDAISQELKQNTNLSAEEIDARAQAAQAYNGENLDQIITGAVLGGIAGSTGLEAGAARLISSKILKRVTEKESFKALAEATAKKMAESGAKEGFVEVGGAGLRKRLLKGAAAEALPEAAQEGQEQLAQNIALQRQGVDVPTMQSVGQSAILGGTLGAITGGPFEAAFGQRPTRIKIGTDGKPVTPTTEEPPAVPPTGEAPPAEPVPEEQAGPETPPAEPLEPTTPLPEAPVTSEEPAAPAAPEAPKTPEPAPSPYLTGDPIEGDHTALPTFTLPKKLAGAKPKFNYRDGSYNPVFFNDVDRALFIVAQPQKSSRDAEYRDFLKSVGFDDTNIDAMAKEARQHVKNYAATNYSSGQKSGAIPIDFSRLNPKYADIIGRATIPEGVAPKPAAPAQPAAPAVAAPPAAPTPPRPIAPTTITFTGRTEREIESLLPGAADIIRQIQKDLFPGSNLTVATNNQMKALGRTSGAGDSRTQVVGGIRRGNTTYGGTLVPGSRIELNFKRSSAFGKTPKVAFLHTLFHELAHLTEDYWIKTSDAATRDEIFKQYLKEKNASAFERFVFVREMVNSGRIQQPNAKEGFLKSAGITEDQFNRFMASSAKSVPADVSTSMSPLSTGSPAGKYYQEFSEWVAEKGARWLAKELEGRTPKTIMEKFQSDVLQSLRDIFAYISKLLGIKPTEGAFEQLLSEVYGVETKVPDKGQIRQRKVITPSTGPNIISEQANLAQEGVEIKTNEAKIPPTTTAAAPTLEEYAKALTAPVSTDSWFAKALADLTGQEKIVVNGKVMYEPWHRALLRNTVAANLPFLERPEFRQVGRLIESVQNMQGRVVGMIKYGALAYDPATKEFRFDDSVGGLEKLFEKAGVARQSELQALTVAMRQYELIQAGRGDKGVFFTDEKTGRPFTAGQLKQMIDSASPDLKEIAENYRKYNAKMLKFALDTGIITKEQSEAFLSTMYTPFYKKQDEALARDGNLVLAPDIQAVLDDPASITDFSKKLGNKDEYKLDPDFYANVLKNYGAIVTMGLKNVAYSNVAAVGIKVNDKTLMQEVGKPVRGSITYRVEGNEKHILINDIPMFQALASLSPKQLQGWARTFARLTELLRLGITSMPGFQIANVWRGVIDTHIKTGMPLFELATQTFKLMGTGFTDTVRRGYLDNPSYRAIIAQQGFGGYNIGSRSKDQAEYLLRRYAAAEGTTTFKQGVLSIIDRLEEIGEVSEMAPRIAYYNYLTRAKDKGGVGLSHADAAYEAMNLVNYGRSGTGRGVFGGAIAQLIPLVPFLNARIQGLYRLMESGAAGGEKAFGVTFKEREGAYGIPRAILVRGLMLTVIEIALQGMIGDEDWYDKLSVQDKVANNYVRVGDTIIALPRPFEIGSLFGAIPSLAIDAVRKDSPKEFTEGFLHILGTTFSFNAIPQAVKPLFDVYYANKDSFTGQYIETLSEQKRPENERMDEYTSEIAKIVAKGVPFMSPKQADALIRGYLGTFGTVFTGTVDGVLSSGGIRPENYFGDPAYPPGAIGNALGLTRFLKTEKILRNDYVSKFYDVKRTVEQISTSIKDAAQSKDFELVREKVKADPKATGLNIVLSRIENNITDINKKMKSIRGNPSLEPEKKTELLKKLREQKGVLAERAYRISKEAGYE